MWSFSARPSRRLSALALPVLLAAVASPAGAQIVAVDAGLLHTSHVDEAVLEVYVAAPQRNRMRPYAIVSWTPFADHDPERPTVITQLAFTVVERGAFWSSLDAGLTWYPFRNYDPDWSVSGFGGLRLPWGGLYLFAIPSTRPAHDWERSLVVGVGRTLYFKS